MKRSEQFRQANREAKTTVLATIVVILAVVVAWWLAEYVIKDVDMKEDATAKGGGK